MSGRHVATLVGVWILVVLISLGLVLYALEPMFQQQIQSRLLSEYTAQVSQAANQAGTLSGVTVPTQPLELGAPVAVVEIGGLRVRQVAVEGVGPSQTQDGPGHVPGTAGPGQPGNSVIVGRRGMFGAPFANIAQLRPDDAILITTTQGQSVYRVTSVAEIFIGNPAAGSGGAEAAASGGLNGASVTDSSPVFAQGESARLDAILGPTTEDRLTLLTPASVAPNNSSKATVVIAKLDGLPFAPTPQGGRSASQTGLSGDSSAWAGLLLALQGFVLAAGASVFLYRRFSPRSAYLLTMPALLAFAVLAAEAGSQLLPAWA
jgi:sortase A